MFVNPMMLPFLIYQRWLEMVFMPFLDSVENNSATAMEEAKGVQSKIINDTNNVATIVQPFDAAKAT
ncbi:hypothetical protein [Rhodoplanes sp. Z2-YC6860]|uniref:hypothetical protein n=1 Tax=Rhodoplanes sp. Z2-YC6860 TaxID=674703 RepID=UPI0012ED4B2A|nr:hypothetical protein [Rhodoplanes sp. Z2-YC6860]